jgi:hypothetical protein
LSTRPTPRQPTTMAWALPLATVDTYFTWTASKGGSRRGVCVLSVIRSGTLPRLSAFRDMDSWESELEKSGLWNGYTLYYTKIKWLVWYWQLHDRLIDYPPITPTWSLLVIQYVWHASTAWAVQWHLFHDKLVRESISWLYKLMSVNVPYLLSLHWTKIH